MVDVNICIYPEIVSQCLYCAIKSLQCCVPRWQRLWLRSSERHRQLLEARTRLNDIALARYTTPPYNTSHQSRRIFKPHFVIAIPVLGIAIIDA